MKSHQKVIKRQRADYKERLRELRAYLTELKSMCDALSTESAAVESDVTKARHDIEYYETELEHIKKKKNKKSGK